MSKRENHVSRPYKSPLIRSDEYHISVSNKVINVGYVYNDNKAERAQFLHWLGDVVPYLIIGILLSSVSVVLHNIEHIIDYMQMGELANHLSQKKIESILKLFPCFAEDAGLSIALALLAIVAGLSVGIAVEGLSKSHMFRFRYMGKALIRVSYLSVCFLGMSAASLLLRYGKGFGILLIIGLLFCFTMFYGIGDLSVNYGSRLKGLCSSLKSVERELISIVPPKRMCIVFSSMKWWNVVLGGFGSLIDVVVCIGISIYHPEQLLFYLIIAFITIISYCGMIFVLGGMIYNLVNGFKESFKGMLIVKILCTVLLVCLSSVAAFYFSLIFVLVPNIFIFCISLFLSFVVLVCICVPPLWKKDKRFLFAETRIAQLKNNIDLTRRLIDLIKTEEE